MSRRNAPSQRRRVEESSDEEVAKPHIEERYRNKALDRNYSEAKFKNLLGDWNSLVKRSTDTIETLGQAAADLEESYSAEGDEEIGKQEIAKLDADVRKLLDTIAEAEKRKQALENLQTRLREYEDITSGVKDYTQHAERLINEYKAQTSRQKYAASPAYQKFRQLVWEVNHDEALPSMNKFIPKEDGDEEEDSDDEMEIGGGKTLTTHCQLTMGPIKKVAITGVCKHVFEFDALRGILNSVGGSTQCPQPGCASSSQGKIITYATMSHDPAMQKRIDNALRRERERVASQSQKGNYQLLDDSEEE